MRNPTPVLSWLRLVQAARNADEQNTEAFLKAGQLYVRTIRDVRQEDELLVWYDHELSHLLGFREPSRGLSDGEWSCACSGEWRVRIDVYCNICNIFLVEGNECVRYSDIFLIECFVISDYKCGKCNQVFKNEYPFLAHCRFLCTHVRTPETWSRDVYDHKPVEVKRQRRVTDFHNIARDLEHKKSGGEDAEISPKRRRHEESQCKGRKTVLLEKTNISNDDNITALAKAYEQSGEPSVGKTRGDRVKQDQSECKTDVSERGGRGTLLKDADARLVANESSAVHSSNSSCSISSNSNSAFSLVLSNSQGEQKSAFCKPSKRTSPSELLAHPSHPPTAPSSRLEEAPDAFSSRSVLGYSDLMAPSILGGDLQPLPSPVLVSSPYHYAPEHWSRSTGVQLQSTSSFTILPPTFTSFGVSVQNWCAKCNLSFRMTSDLVFHMRSHHKKEFAAESQVRRRREEKLTCPICHEYFRERHHLSRHMTSHN